MSKQLGKVMKYKLLVVEGIKSKQVELKHKLKLINNQHKLGLLRIWWGHRSSSY